MKNIEQIFENKKKPEASKRTYDVRVTLNRAGGKRFAVRFGFINQGFAAFRDAAYIQPSSVEKYQERIYFKTHGERAFFDAYKLSDTSTKDKTSGKYFTFTPSEKAEKIYRSKWIGKTFPIKFDEECRLYYIELSETEVN